LEFVMPKFGPRRYRLRFDDGSDAFVNANTPSEAVRLRPGGRASLLPHTITDMTALDAWARGQRPRMYPDLHEPIHHDVVDDDAPLRLPARVLS